VGHIQFQDISRQMIEHISHAVTDMRGLAANIIDYASGDIGASVLQTRHIDLEQLRRSHVMARQRQTHATATGGGDVTDTEPLIELF
jgi:methyl-accepting chemotaxis protein